MESKPKVQTSDTQHFDGSSDSYKTQLIESHIITSAIILFTTAPLSLGFDTPNRKKLEELKKN